MSRKYYGIFSIKGIRSHKLSNSLVSFDGAKWLKDVVVIGCGNVKSFIKKETLDNCCQIQRLKLSPGHLEFFFVK